MNELSFITRWGDPPILMKIFGLPIIAYLRDCGRKSKLSIQNYMCSICFLHISRGNIEFLINRALRQLSRSGYIKQEFYWEITSEGIQYLSENEEAAAKWLDEEKIKYEIEFQEWAKREEEIKKEGAEKSEKERQVNYEIGKKRKIKGDDGEEKTYKVLSSGKISGYHNVLLFICV